MSNVILEQTPARVASTLPLVRPRRRWGEQIVALCCLLLVLAADLAIVRVGLDVVDDGYFIEQAARVVQGQLPYRDFDSLYTPALVYVHAAVLALFPGSPVVDVRIVGLVARLVLAAGLYLVCRPLVRPSLAVLPALYILVALDRLPGDWEPHPGWPSAALTVITAWAFTRLPTARVSRRNVLLVVIGALAGLVFAFKQNAGVLIGLALVASTAWQGIDGMRTDVTRALRTMQLLLLLLVIAATTWLVHPHARASILAYFLIPLLAAGCAALAPVRVSPTGRGLGSWFGVVGWLGLGWSIVTLPWLSALLAALDWHVVLLKGFVGVVNQEVLWSPLEGPAGGAWASLVGIGVGLLAVVHWRRRPWRCAGALVLVVAFGVSMVLLTGQAGEPMLVALVLAPGRAAAALDLFLPVVCIVAGAGLSLRPLPVRTAWWLRWMTVASALTFLTEYPRVDEVHLAWSAALPLATGAIVLARLCTELTHHWWLTGLSRYLLTSALLIVPVASVLDNVGIRSDGFVALSEGGLPLRLLTTTTLTGPPTVDGMAVNVDQANSLIAAAQFVTAHTASGEAIFVYPTSPLLYVLADRPNPTRYAHLYAGAATPAELNQVIATLDETPVNLVVVSESDLDFWGLPGVNAPLETYLVDRYREIARFGPYLVLHRN
ncbi:MAG: hypothetical protein LC797_02210 [Chloroflexi bacterium]|nr:hypothetical protein [Chloroflexota bacterium]